MGWECATVTIFFRCIIAFHVLQITGTFVFNMTFYFPFQFSCSLLYGKTKRKKEKLGREVMAAAHTLA